VKVDILISDKEHPVYTYMKNRFANTPVCVWCGNVNGGALDAVCENGQRDFLFLVSCNEKVSQSVTSRYKHTLVLHGSNLPKGRGWSPIVWDVLNGNNPCWMSLIEAVDEIDAGAIWGKEYFFVDASDTYEDVDAKSFEAQAKLIEWAVEHTQEALEQRQPQKGKPSNHRKRTPKDSQLDTSKSIDEQWNLLRICNPNRYPAYIVKNGWKYYVNLHKAHEVEA
jgi:methionyl-tRNA formyltransferase